MAYTKQLDGVDVTLLNDHKDKGLIMEEIKNIAILSFLFGYTNSFYSDSYGYMNYSQSFMFSNGDYFLKIAFVKSSEGKKYLEITYPIDWIKKFENNNEVFGVRQNVKNPEEYLNKIKAIVSFF